MGGEPTSEAQTRALAADLTARDAWPAVRPRRFGPDLPTALLYRYALIVPDATRGVFKMPLSVHTGPGPGGL